MVRKLVHNKYSQYGLVYNTQWLYVLPWKILQHSTQMGFDFAYNVYICLRIVWINKYRPDDRDNQMKLLQELSTNELIEFTIPLVFILSTLVGYYGPNTKYLLNIGATIWHSTPIENIKDSVTAILIFFVVDFCSTIITAIMLWVFCKINLFKAFVVLMQEYGPIICLAMVANTYVVIILNFSKFAYFDSSLLPYIFTNSYVYWCILFILQYFGYDSMIYMGDDKTNEFAWIHGYSNDTMTNGSLIEAARSCNIEKWGMKFIWIAFHVLFITIRKLH